MALFISYFFSYKMEVSPSKNLEPSHKRALEFWNCFEREKPTLELHSADLHMFGTL